MKFSLVLATLGRKEELKKFLDFMHFQEHSNFEIIIVDQNAEGFLSELINQYKNSLDIKHFRVEFKGLSKARNFGLKQVTGDLVGYPDDDCYYDKSILASISNYFNKHDQVDLISTMVFDPETNEILTPRFIDKERTINNYNLFRTAMSAGIFHRAELLKDISFDEKLGIGTTYPAAEESDFVFKALQKKFNCLFVPSIKVYHPYTGFNFDKGFKYGKGVGAFFKKHFSLIVFKMFLEAFFRPLAAIVVYFYIPIRRKYYLQSLLGRIKGFISFEP